MYALCVSGAVNTQGFVWKFFYALYINFHSFIHSNHLYKVRPVAFFFFSFFFGGGGGGCVCVCARARARHACTDQCHVCINALNSLRLRSCCCLFCCFLLHILYVNCISRTVLYMCI